MTLEKGVATKEDIDKTLKLGMAHPMGPLELGRLRSTRWCTNLTDPFTAFPISRLVRPFFACNLG